MDPKIAEKWMNEALLLALAARGTTLPNPAVACIVLDKTGKMVAKAVTSPAGGPHAERRALEIAGRKAEGGTVIVTLEPCVAFPGKKTPPCAAAVMLSGAETLVVGAIDPNPEVSGRGLNALRKAGMEILDCPLAGRVPAFYAGFGHYLATGKPRVTVKIALSSDGNLACAPGVRTAITGSESRRFVHELRAQSDAILIGGRTALADNPALTVRDAPGRSPHRLVLWPASGLPANLQIWSNQEAVTAIGCSPRPTTLPSHAQWLQLPELHGRVDLSAVLQWCGQRGMHDILVEPGAGLLESLLAQNLWDDLWILRAPQALPGGLMADPNQRLPTHSPHFERDFGIDRGSFWHNRTNSDQSPLSA